MSGATLEEEGKSDGKGFCESFPRPKEIYDLSFWNTSDEMVKKLMTFGPLLMNRSVSDIYIYIYIYIYMYSIYSV